ncbi:autotransporter outer membrane beta-barrel domain-containing protein [Stenotrophomonas sp. TD3]|uniref:autotransporter family protein n=1 Tax=Stenotrophomonas sp. TD3 TaxID=1641707 RepID=UPI0009530F03|nr:autotransporter outer membrane beta-barrel domain-containing protein [Stenotrophomonas sp. TD3]
MKRITNATASRPPTPRLLFRSVLLALASLPTGIAFAGDLDGQTADVGATDPVEAWTLKNGSLLTVTGGATQTIVASDSRVTLDGATVSRKPSGDYSENAAVLNGNSHLNAQRTTLEGSLRIHDYAQAVLTDSHIDVTPGSGLEPGDATSVGLNFASVMNTGNARVLLDNSTVRVDAIPGGSAYPTSNGVGALMSHGTLELTNGSRIDAGNHGVVILPMDTGQTFGVHLNRSTLSADSAAAIWVRGRASDAHVDVTVANGSQLRGGDGILLQLKGQTSAVAGRTEVDFTVDDSRISGDLLLDTATVPNGTINVTLRNKAQIDGRFLNVTSASIDSDSTWLMTGDSNVGHLALGNTGTVALGNGSTFNTLTVDTFDGAGGTLLFNTQLGDDSSATDRLIIKGDANGQANVRVLNAGGAGAKTDKGIELIRVGGASNAQFDLQGRAVGGQYEYFLFKDATNGGWYLRSELAGTPAPCVVDPTLPECTPIDPVDPVDPIDPIDPTPVLRPEAGAYLANQFAMDQMLRHGWRDRQGGNTSAVDGVRGWARVDGTQSKLSAVEDQLDLRVDRSRLQLGADIGVFDNGQGRAGVMGTLAKSDATSRSQLTGYSARGKVNGGALGVYGNWSNDALYVDASVQRGQFRNRVQGEGLAEERYDSDIWQSSLEAGYRIGIGQIGSTALSLQPELQLVYTDANTDRHEEANGTVVRSLGDSGLSGRVGLRLQGEGRSAAGASVSPYVVANWYRDGASNGMAFDDEALKARVPRNRYELNAGARVDFRSGLSAWGGFGVMRGDHGYREATANAGVAYRW